ncbi:acetate/propionate family kinase [Buchnera aphidicola (Ceratoglyphina bambusae)]|uniref:acetate/propionate family kinase n=1 Tax=Buchnera aphidicola TaxID=9 RepID=UPI0031B89CED
MKNLILVLNCGSSSVKFSIIDPINEKKFLEGEVSSLNLPISYIKCITKHKNFYEKKNYKMSHKDAINFIIKKILLKYNKKLFSSVIGIGHRVVNGGDKFKKSVIINNSVLKHLEELISLAPIHNPLNLIGIKQILKYFPNLYKKNVAVFDTSFHSSLPKRAYLYAIPNKFFYKHKIRKYGAHGISCTYILKKFSKITKKKLSELNVIICHLGSGSSVSVIKNGFCIDTSMGFTPLEGLVMGTRSGDIDPSIIFYMNEELKLEIKQIKEILNNKSGIIGLNEKSSDFRYSEKKYFISKRSKISIDIFCYRLVKYISSYFFLINKNIDALIFTGGIGENSKLMREITISKLNSLNFFVDKNKNDIYCKDFSFINKENSIPILVIKTNEEIIIAKDTFDLI